MQLDLFDWPFTPPKLDPPCPFSLPHRLSSLGFCNSCIMIAGFTKGMVCEFFPFTWLLPACCVINQIRENGLSQWIIVILIPYYYCSPCKALICVTLPPFSAGICGEVSKSQQKGLKLLVLPSKCLNSLYDDAILTSS